MKLLDPDSKFMRVMSRLADMMLLNLSFLLTCIPIVTVGASLTALYTVAFKLDTPKEGRNLKEYFVAFKQNFKQSTIIWLLLAFVGAAVFFDWHLFSSLQGGTSFISILFIVMLVIWLQVFTLTFPLLSRFDNTTKQTLKNALILSIAYLPRVLLMTALNVFPFFLLYESLYLFLYTGFIWLALYFSAVAYFNGKMMKKILQNFENKEEEENA